MIFRRKKQSTLEDSALYSKSKRKIKLTKRNVLALLFTMILLFLFFTYSFLTLYEYYKNVWSEPSESKGIRYSTNCFVIEGKESCAPQFIIAGAMKSGTTSLFSYLIQHPSILPLKQFDLDPKGLRTVLAEKEVRFFNDPGFKTLVNSYGHKEALSFYLNLFEDIPPPLPEFQHHENYNKITGEATPMYINQPGVALRIKKLLPYVKIILLLRNPVDRAYSDFWFRKSLASNRMPAILQKKLDHSEVFEMCILNDFKMFEECKLQNLIDNPTIEDAKKFHFCYIDLAKRVSALSPSNSTDCKNSRSALHKYCLASDEIHSQCQIYGGGYSLYAQQLLEWITIFPRHQLLTLQSEMFYNETPKAMRVISRFLRIDNSDLIDPMIYNDELLLIDDQSIQNSTSDSFDWSEITDTTFNIVNPFSTSARDREIITNNGGKKGLQIGAGDTSDYPPLSPAVHSKLSSMYKPINKLLYSLLEDSIYPFPEWD